MVIDNVLPQAAESLYLFINHSVHQALCPAGIGQEDSNLEEKYVQEFNYDPETWKFAARNDIGKHILLHGLMAFNRQLFEWRPESAITMDLAGQVKDFYIFDLPKDSQEEILAMFLIKTAEYHGFADSCGKVQQKGQVSFIIHEPAYDCIRAREKMDFGIGRN